ncbi:MAG TPA: S41 family peptidase [Rhizomicrobium sp.]|jgi:carboxyl-terminal processing protease|nr:S41 family peptidase [Rhizomicrobium sp.]
MKKVALVALGAVAGFGIALSVLPEAKGASDMGAYQSLDLFSNAFERVRANYVRPVQDGELVNAAIQGMVTSLDPHSSYMDAKAYNDMQITTKGEFGGVGIEVTQEDGLIKVISPIDGTPAAKAGIKSGDRIAGIDGTSIAGLPLNDAIDKMRGPAGSKITLTILREGEKKPFDVTLQRAVVQVDADTWRREGDVGYIRLPGFNEQTASGLEKGIRELKKQIGPGIKGYVIDLRNNPGGLLDQAIQVSSDLLNGGEVVSTRGRHPEDTQRYDAKGGGDITGGKPIIVLVNAGTASASEIVSGALQDHKRATIVGMTSFGKGSVQTIIPLGEGGGALRLTTARYFTPSGHSIQAQGIIPDIAVAQGDEGNVPKIARPSEADLPGHLIGEPVVKKNSAPVIQPAPGKKYDDFQLSYAEDLLNGKMTVATAGKPVKAD